MFKPARMTRILVGGHRDHMQSVIASLHEEGVLHLEDYQDASGITAMGSPLAEGEPASEALVRVRGLQKAIDAEGVPGREMPDEVDVAAAVQEAEEAILPVIDEHSTARARLQELQTEQAQVGPLVGLGIDLEAVHDVKALAVFVGTVRDDPSDALRRANIDFEMAQNATAIAVTVRADARSDVERILADHGFSALQVPRLAGTPSQCLARLEDTIRDAQGDLDEADEHLSLVRDRFSGRLAALQRMLQEEVEQTQAPLRFGVTDNTFHLEGWVPRDRVNHIQNVMAARFGDRLYLEDLGDAPRENEVAGEDHDNHGHDDHHEVSADDEAPVQLRNKGPAGKYEFLLGLLAMPRYKELDPTKLIALFFPLFFGLMVGDFIIGLLIVGVALWLRNHRLFGIGGDGVAKPMMWGGIISVIVGLFVFGEGLGLHFVVAEDSGEHSWESAFGITFPEEGFLHKSEGHYAHGDAHGSEAESHASGATLHAEGGTAEAAWYTPHGGPHLSVNGWFNLGFYSKVHDINALLIWSVLIGFVHLVFGLLLGVRNVAVMHGVKLAVQEKVSWLMIIAGTIMLVLGMGSNAALMWSGVGVFLVAVVLLWQGVAHTVGVGFIAILEIPGLLGNLLSYTRLAAIGASKAGMAIAFATIGFDLIGGPAGLVIYLVAALLITLLAILAGFLQSLRLQFVEFFSKFYEGGGRPYVPFGRRAAQPPSSP